MTFQQPERRPNVNFFWTSSSLTLLWHFNCLGVVHPSISSWLRHIWRFRDATTAWASLKRQFLTRSDIFDASVTLHQAGRHWNQQNWSASPCLFTPNVLIWLRFPYNNCGNLLRYSEYLLSMRHPQSSKTVEQTSYKTLQRLRLYADACLTSPSYL